MRKTPNTRARLESITSPAQRCSCSACHLAFVARFVCSTFVRTATLRTASSVFDRAIAKLILLPIVDHDVSADIKRLAECSGASNEKRSKCENAP